MKRHVAPRPFGAGAPHWVWLSLWVVWVSGVAGNAQTAQEHVVAEWTYCPSASSTANVSLVASGPEQELDVVPLLAGSGRDGGFCLSDPNYLRGRTRGAIEVYDRSGAAVAVHLDDRLSRVRYAPLHASRSASGYLWVGNSLEDPICDRPAVAAWVYRPQGPVKAADLYRQIPGPLETLLETALGPRWFSDSPHHNGPACVRDLFIAKDRVVLYLSHSRLRRRHSKGFWLVDRMLRVEMSEDGTALREGHVVPWLNESRFVTPTGEEWVVRLIGHTDDDGMLYLERPWEARAHPASDPSRQISLLASETARALVKGYRLVRPVVLGGDLKGRVYVALSGEGPNREPGREHPDPPVLRYTRRDGSRVELAGGRRYALVVVAPDGRIIHKSDSVYVPFALPLKNWVQPLPDGSGYYELRLLEREAQVVFHPLPAP